MIKKLLQKIFLRYNIEEKIGNIYASLNGQQYQRVTKNKQFCKMGQERTWTQHRNSKMKGLSYWHDFGCPEWQSQAKTHRQGVEEEEGEEQEEEEHDEGDDVPLVVAPQHVLERLPGGGQPEERGGWPADGGMAVIKRVEKKTYFLSECVDISWLRVRLAFHA